MKFLAFSDTHEDYNILRKLIKRAKKDDIEFVLVGGDFTEFERGMHKALKELQQIGKPVYVIPGNHEEGDLYKEAIKKYPNCINVDRSDLDLHSHVLLSYGGDGFSLEDPDFRNISRSWYGKHKDRKIILFLHGPPFATKLDYLDHLERHVGNKDYRKFIERIQPQLVICGHLHETAGMVDEIGTSKVVSPQWEGMVIELP
mgnify:CR=1 FL=1|tara:strand:- start:445 stop:1047 length:603 start_codon:yes stop_codon:yes gene_type:complete